MRFTGCFLVLLLLLAFSGCRNVPDRTILLEQIENELDKGNLKIVQALADSIRSLYRDEKALILKADSFYQIAERIELDFSVTEDKLKSQLRERAGDFSVEEMDPWEKNGWLEWRKINGEKRYFNRAASNLKLLRDFHQQRAKRDSSEAKDPEMVSRLSHTMAIVKESDNSHRPVVPAEMIIKYTLTVAPDAVPPNEIVRCWMPYPKENHTRQQNIRFISASHDGYIIAPDSLTHRTIYMEANAEKGLPVVFSVSYSYTSYGQYFDPETLRSTDYDRNSGLYRKYTAAQFPHICFTDKVKKLTDSIVGAESDPPEIVNRIYQWFSNNIPWAGALEYSIIPDIPGYVIENRRGDCGMQTFLLMSMLRYKGIPVRWQSGWKVPPEGKNLHDWCEVYYEGTGWVPVDVSYGLQYSDDRKVKQFYISGIDAYRLIVNDGIAGELFPEKKFLRSEPFDFQRGEVEWKGGNLYFDKWDYEMEIKYVK